MKLTLEHLTFYQQKKTPTPKWTARIKRPRFMPPPWLPSVSVDRLINVQVETKETRHLEAQNFCHLLNLVRANARRGKELEYDKLYECLWKCVYNPYPTDSKRRQGYARKWLQKLGSPL